MTIGQLSVETSVPASTIRYYERIGVLPNLVASTGQRRYGLKRRAALRSQVGASMRVPSG